MPRETAKRRANKKHQQQAALHYLYRANNEKEQPTVVQFVVVYGRMRRHAVSRVVREENDGGDAGGSR